jgi:Ca2+-binding RTX toxin-like protein
MALADGRFVATWTNKYWSEVAGAYVHEVRGQILHADGRLRGGPFLISQSTSPDNNAEVDSSVTALPDGRFVVVWTKPTTGQSADIYGRIFKVDGTIDSAEFKINAEDQQTQYQTRPEIATLNDGSFVVTWREGVSVGDDNGLLSTEVHVVRYLSNDIEEPESVFTVNTDNYYPGAGDGPAVTALDGNGYAAVWTHSANDDGHTEIKGMLFRSGGRTEFSVTADLDLDENDLPGVQDTNVIYDMINPQITKLSNGKFVVTWQSASAESDNHYAVWARVFEANGQPATGLIPVEDDAIANDEVMPVVTALEDGRFAIAWSDNTTLINDQNGDPIPFGREINQIKLRVFKDSGVPDGDAIWMIPADLNESFTPSLSTLEDGRIVATWYHDTPAQIRTQIIDPRIKGINLVDSGSTNDDHIGTNFVDSMNGRAGHDQIRGEGDNDHLYGEDGNDTLEGGEGNDHLWGGLDSDTLYGGNGDDFMEGGASERWVDDQGNENPADFDANFLDAGAGHDTLWGGAGVDYLYGGIDADFMKGGKGDDVYDVDNAGDVVVEDANAGTDLVIASVNWTLGANVENLTLTAAAWGVGNELANIITGSGGNDVLVGGGGADTLQGGAGDDTYYIDGLDVIVDGSGFDTVYTSASEIYLDNFVGIEQIVSQSKGQVVYHGGQRASTLYGDDGTDVMNAGNADDVLNGGGGADSMSGGAGNDIMNGGTGADRMAGGTGDDTYHVDDAGDVVVELAGQGRDSVFTSVSFSLGGNEVETLTATGSAAISLTGSAHANTITGNAGNNIIRGGAGDDKLSGGLGKDTLYGNAGRDTFAFDDRDTGTSKGRADYIVDFSGRSRDKIDLRAVDANTKRGGDQNFSFIGTKAFSKAGEVRYEKAGRDTYVYLNTDNDKSAEAVIKLKGAMSLQKGWFDL